MKNVNQTSQTSDQTSPNPLQILNATKILDTYYWIKQTTSFSSSVQESLSSLKAELRELKLSLMNEICEVPNSISDIKVNKDVHSEKVKNVSLLQIFQKIPILYCLKHIHTGKPTINSNQLIYYHQVAINYCNLLLKILY